jgi:hypothetical protein
MKFKQGSFGEQDRQKFLSANSLSVDTRGGTMEQGRQTMLKVIKECRSGNYSNFQILIRYSKSEVLREFIASKNRVTEADWNKWYKEWKKLQNPPTVEVGKEASGEVKSDV